MTNNEITFKARQEFGHAEALISSHLEQMEGADDELLLHHLTRIIATAHKLASDMVYLQGEIIEGGRR